MNQVVVEGFVISKTRPILFENTYRVLLFISPLYDNCFCSYHHLMFAFTSEYLAEEFYETLQFRQRYLFSELHKILICSPFHRKHRQLVFKWKSEHFKPNIIEVHPPAQEETTTTSSSTSTACAKCNQAFHPHRPAEPMFTHYEGVLNNVDYHACGLIGLHDRDWLVMSAIHQVNSKHLTFQLGDVVCCQNVWRFPNIRLFPDRDAVNLLIPSIVSTVWCKPNSYIDESTKPPPELNPLFAQCLDAFALTPVEIVHFYALFWKLRSALNGSLNQLLQNDHICTQVLAESLQQYCSRYVFARRAHCRQYVWEHLAFTPSRMAATLTSAQLLCSNSSSSALQSHYGDGLITWPDLHDAVRSHSRQHCLLLHTEGVCLRETVLQWDATKQLQQQQKMRCCIVLVAYDSRAGLLFAQPPPSLVNGRQPKSNSNSSSSNQTAGVVIHLLPSASLSVVDQSICVPQLILVTAGHLYLQYSLALQPAFNTINSSSSRGAGAGGDDRLRRQKPLLCLQVQAFREMQSPRCLMKVHSHTTPGWRQRSIQFHQFAVKVVETDQHSVQVACEVLLVDQNRKSLQIVLSNSGTMVLANGRLSTTLSYLICLATCTKDARTGVETYSIAHSQCIECSGRVVNRAMRIVPVGELLATMSQQQYPLLQQQWVRFNNKSRPPHPPTITTTTTHTSTTHYCNVFGQVVSVKVLPAMNYIHQPVEICLADPRDPEESVWVILKFPWPNPAVFLRVGMHLVIYNVVPLNAKCTLLGDKEERGSVLEQMPAEDVQLKAYLSRLVPVGSLNEADHHKQMWMICNAAEVVRLLHYNLYLRCLWCCSNHKLCTCVKTSVSSGEAIELTWELFGSAACIVNQSGKEAHIFFSLPNTLSKLLQLTNAEWSCIRRIFLNQKVQKEIRWSYKSERVFSDAALEDLNPQAASAFEQANATLVSRIHSAQIMREVNLMLRPQVDDMLERDAQQKWPRYKCLRMCEASESLQ